MSRWLLLERADGEGLAVELRAELSRGGQSKTSLGPFFQQTFEIRLRPDQDNDLALSAEKGGWQGFWLLWRENHVQQSVSAHFCFSPPEHPVYGRSADLLFALAVATETMGAVAADAKLPVPAYPPLAATGVLDENGRVQRVQGVPAKLKAALAVMPAGGLIFYPKRNEDEVDAALKRDATAAGIELCPVERLYDAVDRIGIPVRRVWLQTPYLGLDAFEYEHRSIYFGRKADVAALRERLLDREASGQPGVLIVGASGSGKSSLVRAGLIPALEPQRQEQNDSPLRRRPIFWSVRRLWEPQQRPEDEAKQAVAETIAWRPGAAEGTDETALARSIRSHWSNAPQLGGLGAIETTTLANLAGVLPAVLPPNRRFLWHIDQLEELFTLGFSDDVIAAFANFLGELQTLGVWLVGTLRSDFYRQYQDHLLTVFPRDAVYDLERLDQAEIDEIITKPAEYAGLEFERDPVTQVSLAARLRQDALAGGSEVLPLLEFTLAVLYRKRDPEKNLLTNEAYEAIGGLEGAIGQSADNVYQALDRDARAALDKLLWDLTLPPDESGPERPASIEFTAQSLRLTGDFYHENTPARRLINEFCMTRLLVFERQKSGVVWVRVAHEALLNHWKRSRKILIKLRPDMMIRETLKTESKRWQDSDLLSGLLLPGGVRLSEAVALLERRKDLLAPEIVAYIEASSRRQKRNKLIAVASVFVVALLAVAAWFFYGLADHAKREKMARDYADKSEFLLEQKLEQAQKLAIEAYRVGDSPVAEFALRKAFLKNQALKHTLWGHKRALNNVAFSPDGRTIVSSSLDGTVRLWDGESGQNVGILNGRLFAFGPEGKRLIVTSQSTDYSARLWDIAKDLEIAVLRGHGDGISTVAFSLDGATAATGSADETVRVWDTANGSELEVFKGHTGAIRVLAYSPDGHFLASSSEYGAVRLWEVSSGREIALLKGHSRTVKSIVFSPDGQMIATACEDDIVRLWDSANGHQLGALQGGQAFVRAVVLTPDSRSLAVASGNGDIRVWDIGTQSQIAYFQGHSGIVNALAISVDGNTVASAGSDKTIRLWDIEKGQQISVLEGHTHSVDVLAFNPDGHTLASAGLDGTVRIWDTRIGQMVTVLDERKARGHIVAFSPDGHLLATIGRNNSVLLIETDTGKEIAAFFGHNANLTYLAWSPNGQTLASASRDLTVRLWDVAKGRKLAVLPNSYPLTQVAFSSDGRTLAVSGNPARLWDLDDNDSTVLKGQSGIVYGVSFSPVDRILITTGSDNFMRLWSADNGQEITVFESDNGNKISSAVFSPDGRTLAAVDKKRTVWLWNAQSRQQLATLEIEARSPYRKPAIAFSPDGKTLAFAEGKTVWLWDVARSKKLAAFKGHTDRVNGLSFNSDGRLLATASQDKTVRLWDTTAARELVAFEGHDQGVKSVTFSPNNHALATVTFNGAVRVWNCEVCRPANELAAAIEKRVGRSLTGEERRQSGLSQR